MKQAGFICFLLLLTSGQVCRAQSVRVRVLSRFHPTHLELRAAGVSTLDITVAGQDFVLQPGMASSVAELDIDGEGLHVLIRGHEIHARDLRAGDSTGPAEILLSVPGKIGRRYQGLLTISVREGELAADVEMDLETAVASAVRAESEPGTPLEALKAQAVVTRSYYLAGKGRHADNEFCDLTHCQVLREPPSPDNPAGRAARETRSLVLAYQEKPFAAMFTRSCGGRTRTPVETGLPTNGYPYYAVVCDYCHTNPQRWTRKVSTADAAQLAKGEAGRLAVDRRLGWNMIPSNTFITRAEGSEVILEGAGQGHGIGLCQLGAAAMAAKGANFREILGHYFPNTTLQFFR